MIRQLSRSRDNLFSRYFVLTLIVTAVALVICITGIHRSYAQISAGSIRTDLGIYPEGPAPPLPAAGGIVDDQTFGARIMRVTDEADGANLGTHYSYWPTFNANNTRLLVQGDSGHSFIRSFDPDTFTLGAKESIPPSPSGYLSMEGATWSGTDPNVLYGSAGPAIYAYNAATHTHTLVVDLTTRLPPGEYLWQQSKSLDNDFFAFTRRGSNGGYNGYIVYRKSTDSLIVNDEPELDEVTISKDGHYLLVKTSTQGLGLIESRVLNTLTGQLDNLLDSAPDYAPGHGDAGTGSYVGYDNWRNEMNYRSLTDPHTVLTLLAIPDWTLGSNHTSMLADNEGWALTGFFGGTDDHVLRNEVIQIATDGSQRIRRLFHHRSVYRAYYDSPRANISRDGRFVAFTSNWGGRNRTDLFIAKIQSVAPVLIPQPPPTPTATPTPAPSATPTPPPTPTPTPVSLPNENVVWTSLANSTVVDNRLEKVSGCEGCYDAGAASQQTVLSGDAYLQFTAAETSTNRYVGLRQASTSHSVGEIEFAISLGPGGSAEVRENGGYRRDTPYQSGDVFRVAIESGRVKYYKNDALFFTSTGVPTYPLSVNASLSNLHATVASAIIGRAVAPTPTPFPTPVIPPLGLTVIRAKEDGQNLANQVGSSGGGANFSSSNALQANSAEQVALELFIAEIQQAYAHFNADRGIYPAAMRIDIELVDALQRALQASFSFTRNDIRGFRNHLRQSIGHLELSIVLIIHGNVDNPIDVASYVVRQHYVDFLDREPEQSGNDFWVNQFSACGTDAQCFEDRRIHVSAAFFLSIEFQQTGYFVHRLYKSSYGRVPSIVEFMPDNLAIGQGVIVDMPGWEARLAASKQAFLEAWVQRADFAARYSALTNEQYVDALIANLGVAIDPTERDALILALASGSSRANVLGKLAQNEVFSRSEFNSAFVLMQYFGYLRRDPDSAGFNFWLTKLNQFDGNYQSSDMVKAFLASTEYRSRFSL